MSARIVVVHDDPEFIKRTVTALLAVGHDVTMFSDSMSATEALRTAQRIEILITRIVFGIGQPHGVALRANNSETSIPREFRP
jgi:CheY-like chemotaxis protein